LVSKFGESFGGTGGLSTTTLQQAYDNSTTPEIVINAILDGLSVKNGTGNADNVTSVFESVNTTNAKTALIRADGYISGSTFQSNGFIANNNGLTATTVSASTYLGLPIDIRVTGGTYSSGSAVFTNNTGGTFSVSGFSTVGAFTGTTTLDFGSPISGESSCCTTTVANTNINQFSTVMIRFTSSVNHPDVNDSIIEELTVNQSDIIDGVSFNINAYACGGTWGVYNVIYRIIN
jgi:hypothetical protein